MRTIKNDVTDNYRVYDIILLPPVIQEADQRIRGIPGWMTGIIIEVARRHNLANPFEIIGESRRRALIPIRYEAWYLIWERVLNEQRNVSLSTMGKWMRRDHTTIQYGIARHADQNGLPNLTGADFRLRFAKKDRHWVM